MVDRSGGVSPGQVQHGLQDVGAIFGAGFTEQCVIGLLGMDKKGTTITSLVITRINWIQINQMYRASGCTKSLIVPSSSAKDQTPWRQSEPKLGLGLCVCYRRTSSAELM